VRAAGGGEGRRGGVREEFSVWFLSDDMSLLSSCVGDISPCLPERDAATLLGKGTTVF